MRVLLAAAWVRLAVGLPGSDVLDATIRHVDPGAAGVLLHAPAAAPSPGWTAILARPDLSVVASAEFAGPDCRDNRAFRFRLIAAPNAFSETGDPTWRAWLIPPHAAADRLDQWPRGTTLHAPVIGVAPGARSLWLEVPAIADVQPGYTWWIRQRGQPLARLVVLSTTRVTDTATPSSAPSQTHPAAAPQLAADVQPLASSSAALAASSTLIQSPTRPVFCSLTPLVSDLPDLHPLRAALWPSARDRRDGVVRSAAVHVEPRGDAQLLWLAAPRGISCPPEPRVEVLRDGRFIASAIVERRDDRFWYARTSSAPGTAESLARPGDEARIRSQQDLDLRRFSARVFALRPDGALVNAGEIDGLAAGDAGRLIRNAEVLGRAVVVRAQRDYSLVRILPPDPPHITGAPPSPAVDDTVDFSPAPTVSPPRARRTPPRCVARLDTVSGHAFRASLLFDPHSSPRAATPDARSLLGRLFMLADDRRPVGVALLVAVQGNVAVGTALPHSLDEPPRPGWTLQLEPTLAEP